MLLTSVVTIKPYFAAITEFRLEAEDLRKAIFSQPDPDEQLWYDLTAPDWDSRPVSERLAIYTQIALLVEGAQAKGVNISLGAPEPK